MRAKFVNEAMKDILQPKSEEDILKSFDESTSVNDLLHSSVENGMFFGVKKALDLGADIHSYYDFSIKNASMNGFVEIVEYLLNFAQFGENAIKISLSNAMLGLKHSSRSSQYRKIIDLLELKIKY